MKNSPPEAIAAELENAKRGSRELLKEGRVFSYAILRQIMDDADPCSRLIEELRHRHLFVSGVPLSLPNANVVARPSSPSRTTQPSDTKTSGSDETEKSAAVSSDEMYQREAYVKSKNLTRQHMETMGLYKKHSLDYPLLRDFGNYLEKELYNENFKQEVENVSRYLYYVDSLAPSLEFVRNREKLREYLRRLSEAKLKKQTQLNYLKSLKRFLLYHTVNTNLRQDDQDLHAECKHFIEYIGSVQKSCSKLVSKEITQKRHNMLIEKNQITTTDCWALLKAAKKDFELVIGKLLKDRTLILDKSELTLVVYYLEAILILKHLQRPGVVEHMTVQEWIARTSSGTNTVIGVKEHKTGAQEVASFVLSEEEERWFHIFYTLVRQQLKNSKKRKRGQDENDIDGEENFFLSTSGKGIYNASNDLNRLHSRYGIKPVTSQMARRVFETATKDLTDSEKSLVADYLSHSTATAEKHYRIKQVDHLLRASQLLAKLAGDSSSQSAEEGSSHASHSAVCSAGAHQQSNERLIMSHPVTVDGQVPDLSVRKRVSTRCHRKLFERCVKTCMKLRLKHVHSYFSRRCPSKPPLKRRKRSSSSRHRSSSPLPFLPSWQQQPPALPGSRSSPQQQPQSSSSRRAAAIAAIGSCGRNR
ncbi:hypothetical protein JOB18_000383 [Solea senegalensis]|uniref:Core-binding (CB) domain-containing protein n=1 Tax=Solea senegalensis TaxID=28829 RepID=A0AAV6PEF7_SOLSE|nr:hypothetical protein JOB18_000383 [Solea senegalensis]